jgi:hypothetical protein
MHGKKSSFRQQIVENNDSKEMNTTRRRVKDAMKENREDRILLGGDFNGRIGERGARK